MRLKSAGQLWLLRVWALSIARVAFAQTAPTMRIVGVTNSADFRPGLPQPGSLASLFVTGLEGAPGIVTATTVPLTTELAGVRVWIGSCPAPILAVAFFEGYQQINIQVPWELSASQSLTLTVAQNGASFASNAPAPGQWSVFFVDAKGYGFFQHASDYSRVTPDNPVHAGEHVIGDEINLGPFSHTPATGAAAPFDPLAVPVAEPPVCSMTDFVTFVSYEPNSTRRGVSFLCRPRTGHRGSFPGELPGAAICCGRRPHGRFLADSARESRKVSGNPKPDKPFHGRKPDRLAADPMSNIQGRNHVRQSLPCRDTPESYHNAMKAASGFLIGVILTAGAMAVGAYHWYRANSVLASEPLSTSKFFRTYDPGPILASYGAERQLGGGTSAGSGFREATRTRDITAIVALPATRVHDLAAALRRDVDAKLREQGRLIGWSEDSGEVAYEYESRNIWGFFILEQITPEAPGDFAGTNWRVRMRFIERWRK